jgi:uncharacterized protein YcbK (DUF882 family)
MKFLRPAVVGQFALCGALTLLLSGVLPAATESAIANGDTRTLDLVNPHTGESIAATYRVDGHYDSAVLEKLNWFLRDWRRNEATHMDPRLFDAIWETYRQAGATEAIHVVCGYRSPQTNAMLRRRSRAVAQHSQHMLGKAMDTTMPGMSMEKVREIAMRLAHGGVGFYGDAGFVHIDVGGIRYWPRMSYEQLARVFPDGKTVLIPSNGKPLPGYEEARLQLAANGQTVAAAPPAAKGNNLFAWLFGGGKNADEAEEESPQQVASAQPDTLQASPAAAETAAAAEPGDEAKDAAKSGAPDKEEVAAREDFPVPPHRPNEFLALVEAPLPPDRPAPFVTASLAPKPAAKAGDPIGDLAKASAAPDEATASLPAIITHGASESALARGEAPARTEPQALAYAPVAQMQGLRSAAHDRDGTNLGTAQGAHAAHQPSAADMAKLRSAMLSPTLTGLRRAGRIETAALSQKLAAGYLARFSMVATDLSTTRFAGPAVVGLRAADKSRMVFVDGSVALSSAQH